MQPVWVTQIQGRSARPRLSFQWVKRGELEPCTRRGFFFSPPEDEKGHLFSEVSARPLGSCHMSVCSVLPSVGLLGEHKGRKFRPGDISVGRGV